jgi:hypothetical protein
MPSGVGLAGSRVEGNRPTFAPLAPRLAAGQGARQAQPLGFGQAGNPKALGLAGAQQTSRGTKRSSDRLAHATDAVLAMAFGPAQALSRTKGTITTQ